MVTGAGRFCTHAEHSWHRHLGQVARTVLARPAETVGQEGHADGDDEAEGRTKNELRLCLVVAVGGYHKHPN